MNLKIGDQIKAQSKLNYVRLEGTVTGFTEDGRIIISTSIGPYYISEMLFDIEVI